MRHGPGRCRRCKERWAQLKGGLCRRCARELGDTRSNFEIRRDRQRSLHKPSPPVPRAVPLAPYRRRTVTIHGTEYEVTFDGS